MLLWSAFKGAQHPWPLLGNAGREWLVVDGMHDAIRQFAQALRNKPHGAWRTPQGSIGMGVQPRATGSEAQHWVARGGAAGG